MSNSDSQSLDNLKNSLIDKLKQGQTLNSVLRSSDLKARFDELKTLPKDQRATLGQQLNELRRSLETAASSDHQEHEQKPIDVTAPFDVNVEPTEQLLPAINGSVHPLTHEMQRILDIGYRLGFKVIEPPEIDDDYHMFGSLNFPEGHPARDDFDTFLTKQQDSNGKPFTPPAHTSTMQIRVLKSDKDELAKGQPIAYFIPGRVFRNEDLDPRHEHTFYQLEGVYMGKGVTVANLMATLAEFMSAYYEKPVELKTQPFYFPFTEPSFELAISCPYCDKAGCSICSHSGWIELLGCGLIHPNVLNEADIDPNEYTGFAWGMGFMRLAMIKYGIEDIRLFHNGRLDFLRQFK